MQATLNAYNLDPYFSSFFKKIFEWSMVFRVSLSNAQNLLITLCSGISLPVFWESYTVLETELGLASSQTSAFPFCIVSLPSLESSL